MQVLGLQAKPFIFFLRFLQYTTEQGHILTTQGMVLRIVKAANDIFM